VPDEGKRRTILNKKSERSFTAADISPEHLNKGQEVRFAADIKRLLSYTDRFVAVACPACGSMDSKKAFRKYELDYVTCLDCETVYINPRPTPEVLEIYYSRSENYRYWNRYIFPASENVRREKIFRPRVERLLEICRRHGVEGKTIVEVGAGFGIFCEELKKIGFFEKVIGVEPTPDLAETCRRKGIETIEKPIEQVEFKDENIDVVASFEVIEHLFSPREFIESCYSILSPGGLVVFTCPNVKGFDISVLGPVSDAIDVEHLNYFNLESLSMLLRECGFEVLEALTPGRLDADRVRQAILSGQFDAEPYPFLKRVLIEKWDEAGEGFQDFLEENKLSSHMWIVGRKK
jgi:2-polyprenyl-3-methyl-5-hydroxy-6-metoxy-1,4-benzoquinol methylase